MTSRAVQIQFSIDDRQQADVIIDRLLTDRRIACAQVLPPMTSRYWWEGSIETAEEWLCLCKTTADRADDAVESIAELHPYEVPEVIVLPIEGGAAAYLAWIDASVR